MLLHRILLVGVALGFSLLAEAQPLSDTTYVLPAVTVTATRAPVAAIAAPVRVTVVEAQAIARLGATSVAEVLEARSGAFVRRQGPAGLATLSLRGTGASQTLVLLDGHRIADPQLGQLDFSLLPTVLLARAEVMHGGASPVYGSDGLGGAVHLRSHAPGSGPLLRASAERGAYGTEALSLLTGSRYGRWQATAVAEVRRVEGDFPYENTAFVPARPQRRENADLRRSTLFGTLGYTAPGTDIRLGAWYGDTERGLPGLATTPPAGERQEDRSLRVWTNTTLQRGLTSIRLGGLVQRTYLRYLNPTIDVDDTGRTWIVSLDAEVRRPMSRHWLLGGGVAMGYGTAAHPSLADEAQDGRVGLFANGSGQYGRFLLYPAVRFDAYAAQGTRQTALSPRLGINTRLADGLHLKASGGRSFRMPTFNDRFWQPGGDPDLHPEHGWMLDAALHGVRRGVQAELGVFTGWMRDQIVWQPTSAGVWGATNYQRTRTRGVEASLQGQRPTRLGQLSLALFYTYTDARDRSDPTRRSYDQPLRYVPREQIKAHLGLTRTLGPVEGGFDLMGRFIGRRFVTTDGDVRQSLDPIATLDGRFFVRVPTRWAIATLSVDVDNLTDEPYALIKDQPMPPRHARIRLLLETRTPSSE